MLMTLRDAAEWPKERRRNLSREILAISRELASDIRLNDFKRHAGRFVIDYGNAKVIKRIAPFASQALNTRCADQRPPSHNNRSERETTRNATSAKRCFCVSIRRCSKIHGAINWKMNEWGDWRDYRDCKSNILPLCKKADLPTNKTRRNTSTQQSADECKLQTKTAKPAVK